MNPLIDWLTETAYPIMNPAGLRRTLPPGRARNSGGYTIRYSAASRHKNSTDSWGNPPPSALPRRMILPLGRVMIHSSSRVITARGSARSCASCSNRCRTAAIIINSSGYSSVAICSNISSIFVCWGVSPLCLKYKNKTGRATECAACSSYIH